MITQIKFLQLLPLLLGVLLLSLRPVSGHSPQMDTNKDDDVDPHDQLSSSGVESGSSRIRCFDREKQALLKFKDQLVDTNGLLSSWGNEENKKECCKWSGIRCHNRTNHVTTLDLNNEGYDNRLKGTISSSLLELQHLQYLDLSWNDFGYAPIPEFIGSLTNLRYLYLYYANFGGPIPHQIGNLSKLLNLSLGYNFHCYSKSLDWVSHLHSLEYLDLSRANLSMAPNWLQEISKLTSIKALLLGSAELPDISLSLLPSINASTPLAVLDLSRNSNILSPLILVRWFSNFSTAGLTSIDLSGNSMPGPIPVVFENMKSLKQLRLYQTDLEGGIPKYFGNMSSLTYIDLGRNNLIGELSDIMMNLSGPIERKLQLLSLDENKISGSFSNMSRFSSLVYLSLGKNQLNGSIQEGYLRLPHLVSLVLSSNRLTGTVPNLSFSSSLEELDLKNNQFNGTLPESIGGLSRLRNLWMGSNLLEGIITEAFMSNLSRLQSLELSSNRLTVKFNPNCVFPFQLRRLDLRNCTLGPYFPLWLKTQKYLGYIDISSAGISDIIPSWFGAVSPRLVYLNASNNQMYGVFPNFSFSRNPLFYFPFFIGKRLDLSGNRISGSLTFLCHTREWEFINLSDNMFFGQIPDCFTHFEVLKFLNLANNNFSGKIPHSFGSLCSLSLLHLRNNSFSGRIPTSMGNCMDLKIIDLGENRLTGKIPAWIGDRFSQLKVLVLRFNEFYGSIPSSLCGLPNLQILDLSSNNISGVIPNCVHKYIAMTQIENKNISSTTEPNLTIEMLIDPALEVFKSLENAYFMWKGKEVKYIKHLGLVRFIDLSSNNLTGEIPSEITKLVGLVGLNFSTNNLSGPIPHDIGQLKSLDFLDFSRNHLSGRIPTSLGELSFLGFLNLSYNNLSGKIPPTTQLLTFNESAYMGNSGLCGLPLNKSCPGDESHQDSGSSTDGSIGESEDDKFITGEFYISLGVGFIVGFWGIFGTILLNKGMRDAFFKVLNIVGDFMYVRMELIMARLMRYF